MTDNIILEHLRHIRGKVDKMGDDITDLKQRMTSLEVVMASVKYEVAHCAETDARQQLSLDRLSERIDRIERRLELNE